MPGISTSPTIQFSFIFQPRLWTEQKLLPDTSNHPTSKQNSGPGVAIWGGFSLALIVALIKW